MGEVAERLPRLEGSFIQTMYYLGGPTVYTYSLRTLSGSWGGGGRVGKVQVCVGLGCYLLCGTLLPLPALRAGNGHHLWLIIVQVSAACVRNPVTRS